MVDFLRTLSITISSFLFGEIPKLYAMFYSLAAMPSIIETDQIKTIVNNIYTITSVVMLFAFATKAISGIVNPDNLWDSKKGVTGVLKRSIIALALIVAIPFGFDYFYEFQTKIISNRIIEKFILGIDISADNLLTDDQNEKLEKYLKTLDSSEREEARQSTYTQILSYKIGQSLAQTTLKQVLTPSESDGKCYEDTGIQVKPIKTAISTIFSVLPTGTFIKVTKDIYTGTKYVASETGVFDLDEKLTLCGAYNKAITEDIDYMTYIIPNINSTVGAFNIDLAGTWKLGTSNNGEHYVLHYDMAGLLSVLASGAIVYMLIMFCIDSAVRLIKLTFLEITAPISIMAYIAKGTDMLKKWWNELLGTLISFFLRVAAISFIAIVIVNLDKYTGNLPMYYQKRIKLFIIIATLIFAKKVPELVEKLVGVKINLQGGIGGRLGQMAGVGKVAQNAWKSLGNAAKATATLPLLGLGAAAGVGAKIGAKSFDENVLKGKGSELVDKFKESKLSAGTSAIGALYKSGGGIKGGKAALDAYNKNPNVISSKYAKETEAAAKKAKAIKDRITAAGQTLGLYNAAGDVDTSSFGYNNAGSTQFKNAKENLIDSNSKYMDETQRKILKEADEANLNYQLAHDDSERLESTISYLKGLKSATTSAAAKQKIENLVTDLQNGHVANSTDVQSRLQDIQKLATVSTFTNDVAQKIKSGFNSGSINGYDSALSSLKEQYSSIDSSRQGDINNVISKIQSARDQLVYSGLESAMASIKSNVNLNTENGFNAAIKELQSQLSVVTDSATRTSISNLITQLEASKPSVSGIVTPVSSTILNDIDTLKSSAATLESAASAAYSSNVTDVTTTVDSVQNAEAIDKSVITSGSITDHVNSLKSVEDNNGGVLVSSESLSQKEEDAREKSEAKDKKVEQMIEKASPDQKDNIKGIRKQLKDINKSRIRNR